MLERAVDVSTNTDDVRRHVCKGVSASFAGLELATCNNAWKMTLVGAIHFGLLWGLVVQAYVCA